MALGRLAGPGSPCPCPGRGPWPRTPPRLPGGAGGSRCLPAPARPGAPTAAVFGGAGATSERRPGCCPGIYSGRRVVFKTAPFYHPCAPGGQGEEGRKGVPDQARGAAEGRRLCRAPWGRRRPAGQTGRWASPGQPVPLILAAIAICTRGRCFGSVFSGEMLNEHLVAPARSPFSSWKPPAPERASRGHFPAWATPGFASRSWEENGLRGGDQAEGTGHRCHFKRLEKLGGLATGTKVRAARSRRQKRAWLCPAARPRPVRSGRESRTPHHRRVPRREAVSPQGSRGLVPGLRGRGAAGLLRARGRAAQRNEQPLLCTLL